MISPHSLVVAILVLMGLPATSVRAEAAADPVRQQLDDARKVHAQQRTAAKSALIAVMDAQIKSAGSAGNLEQLKVLTAQKDLYSTEGVLPNLPGLKDPVAQYAQALRKADGELVAAYETAIEAYQKDSRFQDAVNARRERRQLLEGADSNPTPAAPEGLDLMLDRVKSDYQQSIADAKKKLSEAVDARLSAATDAGDLKAAENVQAVKKSVEANGSIPDGTHDTAILSAKGKYDSAVAAANTRLAQGYRDVIRGYTRAKNLDRAQAVQNELDSLGLSAQAPPPRPGGGGTSESGTRLSRALPFPFGANGSFSASKDGIKLAHDVVVQTKTGDFLSKDFIFDVWVYVPKSAEGYANAYVGIGDGKWTGSLGMVIRAIEDQSHGVHLTRGDMWGTGIDDIHEPGVYIARTEKHGPSITFSVGSEQNGKFVADMSQTVEDPKSFMGGLKEKAAHLFFSGTFEFSRVRLITGAAAAAESSVPGAGASPIKLQPGEAPAAPGDAPQRLGAILPAIFTSTDSFSASADGITPRNRGTIISKAANYLDRDFVFDIWVEVPKRGDWANIGIGDGKYEHSIGVSLRPPEDEHHGVIFINGQGWGPTMGDMKEPGVYVVRLDHHSGALTLSVGSEKDGKFEAEMTQTAANPTELVPGLSPRSAHIFFAGAVLYKQFKLTMDDAPATATPPHAVDGPIQLPTHK